MGNEFTSFAEAGAHCAKLALASWEAERKAMERGTKLLQKKIREKFGEYQPQAGPFAAWAPLAEYTKAKRVEAGYTPDDPLLRTGSLRNSVKTAVETEGGHVYGMVGVMDEVVNYPDGPQNIGDIAIDQEVGTQRIPPRSTMGSAAVENMNEIVHKVGEEVAVALVSEREHIYYEIE